jgi:amino acid transporter
MSKKFGTFKGVFVPSTEAILGTVLFLLLPMLTADVGLINMLLIVVLAHSVTLATSFSLADCATNLNDIGGGGMYALSKRSLGKAFGGSIGIQLYFAQAASIGFYCIGFAEPLQPLISPLLQFIPLFQGNSAGEVLLQKQVFASIVFIIFFIVVMIGADFTLKVQTLILVILFGSIIAIFVSPFAGIKFNSHPLYYASMGEVNLFGNRAIGISIFFLTFTQFFPAVTGIDAGVGMSGDLRDPKRSLVRGTFTAIIITFIVYIISTFIFSMINRDVIISGYVGDSPTGILLTDLLGFKAPFPGNFLGLMVLLGILFATSSSALSCFMTAPRTAQSTCRDGILPGFLNFLGKDFKKEGNEPRFAILVTFVIGISVIWIGNINIAAMIVGICFLVVYGWVNGSAFLERISRNPTFRPTSKGHWLISFYGFLASVIAISLFNWIVGILIFISQYLVFQLILRYKAKGKLEGVWWGVLFSFISRGLSALNRIVQGTKNWRPILTAIAFSGRDNCPEKISYLAETIASYKGLVNLHIIRTGKDGEVDVDISQYKIPTGIISVSDPSQSILSIIQVNNFGGISHNTVLMEYTKKIDTVRIINRILSLDNNILLLKNGKKLLKNDIIDIWWRGEKNGNLMVLLAYIMKSSNENRANKSNRIRIIRRLDEGDEKESSHDEMVTLLEKARLTGEVVILPFTEEPFVETVYKTSSNSDLIMMGLPGNYTDRGSKRFFNLNEFFFNKEINRYDELPPILFIKSAHVMNLIED